MMQNVNKKALTPYATGESSDLSEHQSTLSTGPVSSQ